MPDRARPGDQPDSRVLTEQELRTGVRLATGQTHRLVIPTGTLVLTAPAARTFLITHPPGDAGDYAPVMPLLDGFSARIVGLTPDPTPTTRFRWVFTLDYTTPGQAAKRSATRAVFEADVDGGALPSDVLRTHTGRVTLGPGAPAAGGGRSTEVVVAGGALTVTASATVRGVVKTTTARAAYRLLAADNPPRTAVADALGQIYSAAELPWLLGIACQESGRRQFHSYASTRASATTFTNPGEPVTNHAGDGGMGMFQVTDPPAGVAELWDWRANVRASRAIWLGKQRFSTGYVRSVRAAVAELDGVHASRLARQTQAERRASGLPPLTRIDVPDFTPDQLMENTVRGFNGFAGNSRIVARRGQPEFDVAIAGGPGARRLVVDVAQGSDVGTLRWGRVPVSERPQTGDRNYVEHVRRARCDDA